MTGIPLSHFSNVRYTTSTSYKPPPNSCDCHHRSPHISSNDETPTSHNAHYQPL